jgi:hypothetical protein
MNKLFSIIVACMVLSACATTNAPSQLPEVVKVPVYLPCEMAKVGNRPAAPALTGLKAIKSDSSNADTVHAYLEAVAELLGYSKQLEASLDACK